MKKLRTSTDTLARKDERNCTLWINETGNLVTADMEKMRYLTKVLLHFSLVIALPIPHRWADLKAGRDHGNEFLPITGEDQV